MPYTPSWCGDLEEAIDTFPEEPVAAVIIGKGGAERVWIGEGEWTQAQLEWAAKHFEAAANIVRKMLPGAGRA